MKADPRQTALLILNSIDDGRAHLDAVLNRVLDEKTCKNLSARDLRLIHALVFGTLRWQIRIDRIIALFSTTPIKKIDKRILNILRLGIFQILFMSRIPDSAAVNTSVNMASRVAPKWISGFVNGLLRNIAKNKDQINKKLSVTGIAHGIAIKYAFAEWIVNRWVKRFGAENTELICNRMNLIPPLTLRVNMLKTDRERLASLLEENGVPVEPTRYSPEGLLICGPCGPVTALPGFSDGLFQVQDEAAQLVSQILCPAPGETVLDACAGLGGKTAHIAQMMKDTGRIFAIDKDADRLDALGKDMKRLGIKSVSAKQGDITDKDINLPMFDRILVDAPCSGMGVIRRNPDIKLSASQKRLASLGARQLNILNSAARFLAPGGILVFAVCSIEPEETEDVRNAFLSRQPNFHPDIGSGEIKAPVSSIINENGCLFTFPHLYDMDGFFIARFKKKEQKA
ncbi:MAG: 16S rRNA (cytosine(967)-C(5))-methyltransferase RsmB [Deltaproteobacteria bacterium]|nr:16S rRNA (cytosine(967)-C(5))-methyltransferase RsmB [Deltaproteobacteria bacterium]